MRRKLIEQQMQETDVTMQCPDCHVKIAYRPTDPTVCAAAAFVHACEAVVSDINSSENACGAALTTEALAFAAARGLDADYVLALSATYGSVATKGLAFLESGGDWCCNCAKKKGWSDYDQCGCSQCKTRNPQWAREKREAEERARREAEKERARRNRPLLFSLQERVKPSFLPVSPFLDRGVKEKVGREQDKEGMQVGDRVRVKKSVDEPAHGWGNVNHSDVGTLTKLEGNDVVVDFPRKTGWKGKKGEIEVVTPEQEKEGMQVGDRVRVKKSVDEPAHGWGSVNHNDVGTLTEWAGHGIVVDFPNSKGWKGKASEIEVVPPELKLKKDALSEEVPHIRQRKLRMPSRESIDSDVYQALRQAIENRQNKFDCRYCKIPLEYQSTDSKVCAASALADKLETLFANKDPSRPASGNGIDEETLAADFRAMLAERGEGDADTMLAMAAAEGTKGARALRATTDFLVSGCDCCCNCAKKKGWSVYDQCGCSQCKTRNPQWAREKREAEERARREAEKRESFFPFLGRGVKEKVGREQDKEGMQVGDRVRVKKSVDEPAHGWGNVNHSDVGTLTKLEGNDVVVDFPRKKGWKGKKGEIEVVTPEQEKEGMQVGDRVRVKKSVDEPAHGWGSVNHNDVGTLTEWAGHGIVVDFPNSKGWKGKASEIEVVPPELKLKKDALSEEVPHIRQRKLRMPSRSTDETDERMRDLAMRLGEFYLLHDPLGLDKVPQLVKDFSSEIETLNMILRTKYDADLSSVDTGVAQQRQEWARREADLKQREEELQRREKDVEGRRRSVEEAEQRAGNAAGVEIIAFSELELERKPMAHGSFKEVYRAMWKRPGQGESTIVAVLLMRGEGSMEEEVAMMKKLGRHPHLCRLLGTTVKPPSGFLSTACKGVVMEFAEMGSLDVMLHRISDTGADRPTDEVLLTVVDQVCEGMKMLSEHKIVHRDVAARNCLVFGFHPTIRNHVHIKVTDYGLAVDADKGTVITTNAQGKEARPIRWMAPEAIETRRHSQQSDVYSYGVLIWEVFELGKIPFWSVDDDETVAVRVVEEGARPKKPDGCPDAVYAIMQRCWKQDRAERPTFAQLKFDLQDALVAVSGRARAGSEESDEGLCVLCLERTATHALLPCGHKCVCQEDVVLLQECPLCRSRVESFHRIY